MRGRLEVHGGIFEGAEIAMFARPLPRIAFHVRTGPRRMREVLTLIHPTIAFDGTSFQVCGFRPETRFEMMTGEPRDGRAFVYDDAVFYPDAESDRGRARGGRLPEGGNHVHV